MTPDLLSFLVAPNRSGSAAIQIGVARDLVAARVLARKADEGHPHAKAFVENAQEQMAQAKIRRARADRLRAGASRASRFGYHDLARMGCEAAIEEEREAQALDANVIGAVRATHAEAFGGYNSFSPEEEKMLQRKAFEDSQTSSQREDTMNKLLSNLYASAAKMGGDEDGYGDDGEDGGGDSTVDLAAYLHAASAAFGGDLDSVFGADAAERMGAVSRAAMHKVRADLRRKEAQHARLGMESEETRERSDFGLDDLGMDWQEPPERSDFGLDDLGLDDLGLDDLGLDDLGLDDLGLDDLGLDDLGFDDDEDGMKDLRARAAGERAADRKADRQDRRQQRRQLRLQIKELRRKLKALRHSSEATGDAEDERVGVDAAEDEQLEMALSDFGADFGADDEDDDGTGKGSGKKLKAGRVLLAIASGGVSEAVRAGAHAAGKPGSAKVVAKLKTLSDKKVRAIMNDGLRTKSVRLAAKAELKRRAALADGGGEDEGEDASDLTVKVPGTFTEKSYLDSYKGVAPPRKRFVKFFKDRAAKMGADDAGTIALAVQAPEDDSFGGFFSAIGEFFSNIFKVGKKDAGRIKHASKAGRKAAQEKKEALHVAETRQALHTAQLAKLKNKRAAEPDAEAAVLEKQIEGLRKQLRTDREEVKKARVAAFDADFSPVAKDFDDGKGYIYRPNINEAGDILIVTGLNRDSNTIVSKAKTPRKWQAITDQIASGVAAPVARVPLADPGSEPAADKIVVNRPTASRSKSTATLPASGMFLSQADADEARASRARSEAASARSETADLLRSVRGY